MADLRRLASVIVSSKCDNFLYASQEVIRVLTPDAKRSVILRKSDAGSCAMPA